MKTLYKRSLVWLRRDLRLDDNRALYEACQLSDEVVLCYIFDPKTLKAPYQDNKKTTFIFDSLKDLQAILKKQSSTVLIKHEEPIPCLLKLTKELSINAIFINREYEPYTKERDENLKKAFESTNTKVHSYKDHVIFESNEVLKESQDPYKVFTAYKNAWLKKLTTSDYTPFKPKLKKLIPTSKLKTFEAAPTLSSLGFNHEPTFFIPGPTGANKALNLFKKNIKNYEKNRNYPFIDKTSKLSAHLRYGTISTRELVRISLSSKTKGHQTYLNELIWRDFFQMLLDYFPDLETTAFQKKYRTLKWPGKKEHLELWKQGMTGFPIVDAAMRQLNTTGWMHNRLRMIVASFLTKDLLIDWKEGEAYFAKMLVDYDKAANIGGWQWAASVGCDAQPYFRIFNPETQSKRFDKNGDFIKRYCPELKNFSNRSIGQKVKQFNENNSTYPEPIVCHGDQRLKALSLFKSI